MPEASLRRNDLDPSPIRQFGRWFKEATEAGIKLPEAMTLATATPNGAPSARQVLLKGFDDDGFTFFTNYTSQKATELDANPQASLLFYWSALDRQVRISGPVSRTSESESEAYFHTRPVESQLAAWASRQSSVIASRNVLERRMQELEARYAGQVVPLPSFWGGYRVHPLSIEFWQNRPNRLHDRFRYSRPDFGAEWRIDRLDP